jgi:hypothetical protein
VEQLKPVRRDDELSLYRVDSETSGSVEEYVFSTPETRRVCNEPEMVGLEFPRCMREATARVLQAPPLSDWLADERDRDVSVMHFLRGGLNFQLREALGQAYGFNKHYCAYMTSQRHKTSENWVIEQDQYRKIRYLENSTVMIGDVIATGSTMENGMEVLLDHVRSNDLPFKNLIVFTIGCDEGRKILEQYEDELEEACDLDRLMLFYAEGKFGLAGEDSPLTFKIPGTDLLRDPALLTPEYEKSIYQRLHIPIERCAIYDVGAKSFEYQEHVEDVIDYWRQLRDSDLSLKQAYRERWTESDYGTVDELYEARRSDWPFIERSEVEELHRSYEQRWDSPPLSNRGESHEALEQLADERIGVLEGLLDG